MQEYNYTNKIPIPKEKLGLIPANERSLFILLGHLHNDITILMKLLESIIETKTSIQVEKEGNLTQRLLILKTMIGKLNEGWELIKKGFYGSKISFEYEPLLSEKEKKVLNSLKKYFSKKNIVNNIRNSFAFHYDFDSFKTDLDRFLPSHEELYVYAGPCYNYGFYFFSEIAINWKMLLSIDKNIELAWEKIHTEISAININFLDFINIYFDKIMIKYIAPSVNESGAIRIEIPEAVKRELNVPFFYCPHDNVIKK